VHCSGSLEGFIAVCSRSADADNSSTRSFERALARRDITVPRGQFRRLAISWFEEAARRCGAGIFLFTKDDALEDGSDKDRAVPRDNVVFEAGYFSALKGKSKVLIVRESGAKMPADLGGDIYAALEDRGNIEPIKPALYMFVAALWIGEVFPLPSNAGSMAEEISDLGVHVSTVNQINQVTDMLGWI
jgi:hypothetical protein